MLIARTASSTLIIIIDVMVRKDLEVSYYLDELDVLDNLYLVVHDGVDEHCDTVFGENLKESMKPIYIEGPH